MSLLTGLSKETFLVSEVPEYVTLTLLRLMHWHLCHWSAL